MQRSKGTRTRRQRWQATASHAALLGGLAAMIGSGAFALPTGPFAQTSNGTTPTFSGDPVSGVTGVTLTAPRTIVDWETFTVNAGETFTVNAQTRSDIVLNRIEDPLPIQINGTLQSFVGTQTGGNVWFSAPGGVFFGPTAVVNVGGLLATTAVLLDDSQFLDPTKTSFTLDFGGNGSLDPTGSNVSLPYYGGVVVQSGARISTNGGLLALAAPFVNVQPGAVVGGGNTGDVLIGGVEGYTISLKQETSGDLDLLEFQVLDGEGLDLSGLTQPINIGGAVSGRNVYVMAVTASSLANAIVTDSGSLTATGAVQQGNGVVILTADTLDLVPASYPNGSLFDPNSGTPFPGGANVFAPQYATPLSFGNVTAPQIYIHSGGSVAQTANTAITGGAATIIGGDISLAAVNISGSFQATAIPLSADQYIQASPPTGTVGAAGAITANDISVNADGFISLDTATATGGNLVLTSANGSISANSLSAAGDLTVNSPNWSVQVGTNVFSSTDDFLGVAGGPVTGRTVTITGGEGVTAGDVKATGGALAISAPDADIQVNSATAAGAASLTAPNGAVAIGSPAFASDLSSVTGFNLGAISATGDVTVSATSIAAGVVSAGGRASLIAAPGSPSSLEPSSVEVASLSAGTAFVQAQGEVYITSANVGSGGLEAHALGSNGNIYLGYPFVFGGVVAPLGERAGGGGAGTLTGAASLYADNSVSVDVAGSANLPVIQAANLAGLTAETGDLTIGAVTAGGALTAAAPQGSLSLAALQQAGQTTLSAGTDVTVGVQPAAVTGLAQAGRDLTVMGTGALDLTAFRLSAGRDVNLSSPGLLAVPGFSAGRTATLSAGDLSLQGALTAPTVTIASLGGPLTLGGSGTGLVLDPGEFGRITASTVNLYAGALSGSARGDLTVQDLAIDPAKVGGLNLYAGAGHTVSVMGLLAPTTSGGALSVGGQAGWTPTTILVSGGLGTATHVSDTQFTGVRAFGQVSLNALGDILLGSPRFIGVVQAAAPGQINQALNLPAGAQAQGTEIGRVYLAAGSLAVAAGGKVVGQNTSIAANSYSGLYLTNTPGAPGVVLSVDPPSVVDLFGSYVNTAGVTASGRTAAVGPELKVLAGDRLNYRFNGCVINVGCGGSSFPGPAQGLQPLNGLQAVFVSEATDAADATDAAEATAASGSPGARVQPPTFSVVPSADTDVQADPVVTGTGNEEIWRKRGGNAQ